MSNSLSNDDGEVACLGCTRRVSDAEGNKLEVKLGSDGSVCCISGKIVGDPETMPRPRGTIKWTSHKPYIQYYNPKQSTVKELSKKLKSLVERADLLSVYSKDLPLMMVVYFHMKRPQADFKSNKRENGLKSTAGHPWSPTKKDVDNLAKFILDAGNNTLYEDDKSIVVLMGARVFHSEGLCDGCTCFRVKPLTSGDIETFDKTII